MFCAAGYFDESDDNERAYSVAGFLGPQKDCLYLHWEWEKRILAPYNLEYFKASELNSGKGQFAQHRDNPKDLDAKFSEREKELFNRIKIESIDGWNHFDSHETYRSKTQRMFDDFKVKNPASARWLLRPSYEDEKDYVALQAADNLAYECRRLLITEEYDKHIPERVKR